LDLEKRASHKPQFSPSDLKSFGPACLSYGRRKEMRLVGIEASQRDLQLSFRGSKIRVKVSGERFSGFQGKKLRSMEVGAIYRGVGQLGS
jgi:hypothetical protein